MDWKQAAEWSDAALTEVRRLGAEVDRLRALLKRIEWSGEVVVRRGSNVPIRTCLVCHSPWAEGHNPDCDLARALTP